MSRGGIVETEISFFLSPQSQNPEFNIPHRLNSLLQVGMDRYCQRYHSHGHHALGFDAKQNVDLSSHCSPERQRFHWNSPKVLCARQTWCATHERDLTAIEVAPGRPQVFPPVNSTRSSNAPPRQLRLTPPNLVHPIGHDAQTRRGTFVVGKPRPPHLSPSTALRARCASRAAATQ